MASGIRLNALLGLCLACLGTGMIGCTDGGATAAPVVETTEDGKTIRFETVEIRGTTYKLEVADDDASRLKGLSGRASIPETGGMIFVFRRPELRFFVMRDCLVDIDIIFLDGAGRITEMHAMKVEEPRGEKESMAEYEGRLRKYSSRYPAQVVIELKGGTIAAMDPPLRRGDRLAVDVARMARVAK